jgi:hypothetical protein
VPHRCRGAKAPGVWAETRPHEGSGAPRNAGAQREPPGRRRTTPARVRGVPPSLAIGKARLSALCCGFFRSRATLSTARLLRCRQPAPGGRSVVTSRWSPGPPGSGMPAGRGCRPLLRSLDASGRRPSASKVREYDRKPILGQGRNALRLPGDIAKRLRGSRQAKLLF